MKCPYCAEEIQDNAIKCKICWSDLDNLDKRKRMESFVAFLQRNENNVFHETYRSIPDGIIKLEWPKADFSWMWFILMFWIFYLIYHWAKKNWYVTLYFDENGWYRRSDSNQKQLSYLFQKYKKENTDFAQAVDRKREWKKWYQS